MTIDTYALTTREAVKNYRLANGEILNTTPEIDGVIDSFINSVSAKIENYCDRKFLTRTHTEYFDGASKSIIFPKQYPIISVTSINDDSEWVWGSSTLIASTNYRIANDNSIVLKSTAYNLGDYVQNVKLVYVAGYTTIPYDLENACIIEVLRIFDNIKDIGIFSKSSDSLSNTYVIDSFLADTKTVFDSYKRKEAF